MALSAVHPIMIGKATKGRYHDEPRFECQCINMWMIYLRLPRCEKSTHFLLFSDAFILCCMGYYASFSPVNYKNIDDKTRVLSMHIFHSV